MILDEDADLLAVAKPAGIPVIPARGEDPGACLQKQLEASRGERLWVVHRIDRDTSGVVVFARTAASHRALSMAFEAREMSKTYVAFAAGALDGVTRIDLALHEARKGKSRPAAPGEAGGKPAVTEIEVEARWTVGGETVARVRCHPVTGRHHQIRVHLRAQEAPIVHDPLYGKRTLRGPLAAAPCPRLALHAAALVMPGGRTFRAPLPDDMQALEAWLASKDG
jgi:tRNA pseudouridine32 synthase/23S rRNA pseudouridine746 synthase